jgi:hypothetical protein
MEVAAVIVKVLAVELQLVKKESPLIAFKNWGLLF